MSVLKLTKVLLQTIAMQNLQLQQTLMQTSLPERLGYERLRGRRGQFREEMNGDEVSFQKPERYYQVAHKSTVGITKSGIDRLKKPITKVPESVVYEMTRSDYLKRQWRITITSILFYTAISKKWLMKRQAKQSSNFITAAIEDLDTKLYPFFKPIRDLITEVSTDGADFLIKEGLGSLFAKRPTKLQSQKFGNAINMVIDLVVKVTFLGSPKSKELVNRIISAERLPKSFYWESEEYPATTTSMKSSVLVYFILIKCIMTRMVFRAGLEYTEMEERNTRAMAYVLYRMARGLGRENSPLPIEPQFKKIIFGFCNSQEEANTWNDTTCKTLYKNFATEMTSGVTKLIGWAVEEINGLETLVFPSVEPVIDTTTFQPDTIKESSIASSSPRPPTLAELIEMAAKTNTPPVKSDTPPLRSTNNLSTPKPPPELPDPSPPQDPNIPPKLSNSTQRITLTRSNLKGSTVLDLKKSKLKINP